MFRRLTAAALVLLVQVGAVCAPLLHVHAGEEDGHEALHAHLPDVVGTAGDARVDHGDEGRPYAPQVFVAVAPDLFDAPALGLSTFTLTTPPEMMVGRGRHVTHGHDPPHLHLRPSRAPPAQLS